MPRSVSTVLTLKDKMSDKLLKIQSTSANTANDMRKRFATVGQKWQKIGGKITKAGQTLTTGVTLPLVGMGTVAAKKFADVDKTMTLVKSTMGDAKFAAADLNQAMKEAASNSIYGMDEAAQAALNFARGGWDAEQAANALAPAMNLAAGEGGDLDTVSAGLMATMNSFGAEANEAADYADVFANACNNSALDVNSLADSMSIAAPIFKTSGGDVKDAALAMGVMANAGTNANVAANALKTGVARLASPAKQGAEWMEKLGISAFDSQGNLKDMQVLQGELSKAFSTLSAKEKEAAAGAIFGKNQMAPWLALIGTAPNDVAALNNELGKTGTASKMSSDMMSGFGGSLEKLKSTFDVLATSVGEALAPYIQKAVDVLQSLTDKFNSLSPKQKDMIVKIGMIVAAIGPALMIIGKLVTFIGTVIAVVGKVIAVATTVYGVISKIVAVIKIAIMVIGVITGLPAAAVAAIAAAVVAILALIIAFRKQIWEFIKSIPQRLSQLWETIKAKVAEWLLTLITKFFEFRAKVREVFAAIGKAIMDTLSKPFKWVAEKVEGIKNAVGGFFKKAGEIAGNVVDTVTGKNASGTPYWRGGRTLVGEQGPEIVDLPGGSKIYSNQKSQKMTGGAPTVNLSLNIQGNLIGNAEYANMLSEQIAGTLIQAMAN